MKDTVEVALVGQKEHAFSADAITWQADGQPPEFLTPWEQRERVSLEVYEPRAWVRSFDGLQRSSGFRLPTTGRTRLRVLRVLR